MSDNRISIVFVRTAYGTMGGRAKMLLRLLDGIDKEKFQISVVTQRKDEFYQRATELDIRLEVLPFQGILNTYGGGLLEMPVYKQAVAGLRLLQYNITFQQAVDNPDVIWFDGTRSFVTLLPYVNLSSITSIWAIGLLQESDGIMSYINSATLRSADHVFIESEDQAKRLLTDEQYGKYRAKFTSFNKGIDTKKFSPESVADEVNSEKLRIGTAALINPRKGLEYFIDAAVSVLKDYPNAVFTIAGEPARENDHSYQNELERRVYEHGISDNVKFLGWVKNMPQYLSSLDVFVLPSLNEGIPGAVREALAMEVPTIATDVGGVSDVIIDGQTGFLVEPENSKAIADATIELLDNPGKRDTLGEQGRQYVIDEFSIDSYIERYEEFLKQASKQ